MKFPKISGFYFLLSACLVSTNIIASEFEAYLSTYPTAKDQDKYGIMANRQFTTQWNTFAQSKRLKNNDRLSAAWYVTRSYHSFAQKKELKGDKETANELSKRLCVATQLISEEGIEIKGKPTHSSNIVYLEIALTEGSDLAAMEVGLGKKYERNSVLAILLHTFNFDHTANTSQDLTPENLLRFQLAALAFHGYTIASSGQKDGLSLLAASFSPFEKIIKELEHLVEIYTQPAKSSQADPPIIISAFMPTAPLSKALQTLYRDSSQTRIPVKELEGKYLLLFVFSPKNLPILPSLPPNLKKVKGVPKWQFLPYYDIKIDVSSDALSHPLTADRTLSSFSSDPLGDKDDQELPSTTKRARLTLTLSPSMDGLSSGPPSFEIVDHPSAHTVISNPSFSTASLQTNADEQSVKEDEDEEDEGDEDID